MSVVIVWLHGAFGAGKTSVAAEICARRDEVVLFDPEVVGYVLREVLPVPTGDFQDLPEWRALVVAMGEALDGRSRRLVLAPMTLLREDYAREIFDGLRARGVALHQVLLDASDEELRRRIDADASLQDGDPVAERTRSWRLAQLTNYDNARSWLSRDADVVVDTTDVGVAETATTVLRELAGC